MTTSDRPPTPPPARRQAELDGLRGLAAATILAYHLVSPAIPYGWAAVDLFFAISGYLITAIILRDGGSTGFLRTFYARRSLRIWPIYYLLIAALWAVGSRPSRPRHGLAAHLAYLQGVPSYWGGYDPVWEPMAHTWTLAAEEQFYLLWPALVLAVGCRSRRVAPLAIAGLLASVACRHRGVGVHLLAARGDGLALGGLLATLRHDRRPERALSAFAIGIALAASSWPLWRDSDPIGGTSRVLGASLVAYAVVAWATRHAGSRWLAPLRWPPVVGLGTISYGLYLYHYPVMWFYPGSPGTTTPVDWAAIAAITLVTAVASWYLVERPVLGLKRRFDYRETR